MDCIKSSVRGEEFTVLLHGKQNIKKIYIELTGNCNLECKMCFRNGWMEKTGDMSWETVDSIISSLKELPNLKTIVIGGLGEPLVHPNFKEIVKEFSKYNLDIVLTSNGTLLEKWAQKLIIESNVKKLVISVDSPDNDIFNSIRNTNLQLILENLKEINSLKKKAKKASPLIAFEFVIMESNYKTVVDLIDIAKEYNIKEIILSNIIPYNESMKSEAIYYPSFNKDIIPYLEKAKNKALASQITLVIPEFELKTDRQCNFIDNKAAVIKNNGEVIPCYRFMYESKEYVYGREKHINNHSFGNVNNEKLKDIWISKNYLDFRFKVKNNLYVSCTDCKFVEGCDLVLNTELDCLGNSPSCGDCLWSRRITLCP